MLGRSQELELVGNALVAAGNGTAAVIGFRGPAGSGKTALLHEAVAQAEGFTVLRVTGVETEADLSFAALLTMFRPLNLALAELPVNHQRVLGRITGQHRVAAVPDRFSLGASVLQALAMLAERGPILLVIDDLQWVDATSRDALLFACRRLHADQLLVLLAWRDSFDLDDRTFVTRDIQPLEQADAEQLLLTRHAFADRVAVAVARKCHGLPLALIEVAANLTERERRGLDPLKLAPGIGHDGEQLFRNAVQALSPDASMCVLICALTDKDDLARLLNACAAAGVGQPDWDQLERARLIKLTANRVTFTHPLARSAVVQLTPPVDHRKAHLAIAAALPPGEERTNHRAAATVQPDELIAAELHAVAQAAIQQGDHSTAGRAAERSALLSPDPANASQRWLLAAQCAATTDQDPSPLLARAEADGDAAVFAECTILRAAVASWSGDPSAAALVADRLGSLAETNPAAASIALAFNASAAWNNLDITQAARTAREAWELSQRADALPYPFALMPLVGYVSFASFDPQGDERAHIDRCVELLEQHALTDLAMPVVTAMLVADRHCEALAFGERMHTVAAGRGAVASAAWTATACGLASQCLGDLHGGRRWLQLAREFGSLGSLGAQHAYTLATAELAQIEAQSGSGSEYVALMAEMATLQAGRSTAAMASFAAVLHSSANGDLAEVVRTATPLAHEADSLNEFMPALVELVEALVGLGRTGEAQGLAQRLDALGASKVVNHAGQVERCRALLAEPANRARHFERSIVLLANTPRRLELARSHLLYGEHLRRAGSRSLAREQLQRALTIAERSGAAPLATRARRELRATGLSIAPAHKAVGQLTAQEAQVGHAVASGRSTREVATLLFLSPRTVEMHLTRIYRKLGVENRRELAALHRRTNEPPRDDRP